MPKLDGIRVAFLALCLICAAEGLGLLEIASILRWMLRRRR